MNLITSFQTITAESSGSFSTSGSKFYAYAIPAKSEETLRNRRDVLRREHPKAVHVVTAGRFGPAGNEERFNDDGEPAGSAGRPVLHAIKSAGLTEIGLLVVRYFGSKKLGVPGLIQAYRSAATDALQHAQIIRVLIHASYTLRCKQEDMPVVLHKIIQCGARITESQYGEMSTFIILIALSEQKKFLQCMESVWQADLQFNGTV